MAREKSLSHNLNVFAEQLLFSKWLLARQEVGQWVRARSGAECEGGSVIYT